jgi:hypothetical protein
LGDTILHVTRDENSIQALNFEITREGYVDNDISRLSRHIFEGGIKEWAFQQNPNRIIWIITGIGGLVGLVYNQRDQVTAFFRRELNGSDVFESVSTIRGVGKYDQLWVTVNRGGTRTIERLSDPTTTLVDMCYMDGAIVSPFLGGKVVSGLGHFEGREVIVWNDGAHEIAKTVTGGQITLENDSLVNVIIGAQYEKEGVLVPLEAPAGDGASRGKMKSCNRLTVGTTETVTGFVGYKFIDDDNIDGETEPQLLYPADTSLIMGEALPTSSRTWSESMDGTASRIIKPYFRGFGAAPLNVTFIIAQIRPKGD